MPRSHAIARKLPLARRGAPRGYSNPTLAAPSTMTAVPEM